MGAAQHYQYEMCDTISYLRSFDIRINITSTN